MLEIEPRMIDEKDFMRWKMYKQKSWSLEIAQWTICLKLLDYLVFKNSLLKELTYQSPSVSRFLKHGYTVKKSEFSENKRSSIWMLLWLEYIWQCLISVWVNAWCQEVHI